MRKFAMGTHLPKEPPSNFKKGFIDDARLGARPLAHATFRSMLIEFGGDSVECSTSSAIERSAMA